MAWGWRQRLPSGSLLGTITAGQWQQLLQCRLQQSLQRKLGTKLQFIMVRGAALSAAGDDRLGQEQLISLRRVHNAHLWWS